MQRPRPQRLAIALTLAGIIPSALWPGDAKWVYDEPAEVHFAWQANREHRLAAHALSGDFSVHYGPLPIQLNQLLLLPGRDPRVLVCLRATLFSLTIALCLIWLGCTLELNLWFAPAVMLAPHLWTWNRQPWAAYMAVPVSALAVAAYAAFLNTRRAPSLLTALTASLALPLIHPQSLPLSTAVIGHCLWRHRPALRAHKWKLLAALAALAALHARYLPLACADLGYMLKVSRIGEGHTSKTPKTIACLGALMGGRLFSNDDFDERSLDAVLPAPVLDLARWAGRLPIALVWIGIARVLARLRRKPEEDVPPAVHALHSLCGVLLLALAIQTCLIGLLAVPPKPYYQFGVFGLNVLAAWIGLESLGPIRPLLRAVCLAALATFSLGSMGSQHHLRIPGEPALGDQIKLTRALNAYDATFAWTDVPNYRMEPPYALWTLRTVFPADAAQPRRHAHNLFIHYGPASDGKTWRLELRDPPPGSAIPAGAKRIGLNYPAKSN